MTASRFRVAALGSAHDRSSFSCGQEALDRYFKTQVTQDIRRHIANCFAAVEAATNIVAAYYTLSAAAIALTDLPPDEARRLPRYPAIPAVRIGRLAVDARFQGCGLGAAMLADATARAVHSDIAAFMLAVDAKDENAVAFYRHFGFRLTAGSDRCLFLPLVTARQVFGLK